MQERRLDFTGFSKPKIPKANPELEKKQIQLLDLQIAEASKPVKIPDFKPAAPVKYPPPPSATSGDALDAENRARKLAAQRRGQTSTLLAPRPAGLGVRQQYS